MSLGSRLKAAAKKVGDKARDIAGNVVFAPMLPLLPAMRVLLKKKGIKYGDLEDTTRKFFQMITSQQYEDADFFEYEGFEMFDDLGGFSPDRRAAIIERRNIENSYSTVEQYEEENFIDPVTAGAAASTLVKMVKAIVQFFKDKKRAQEEGAELRPEEKEALKKVDAAAKVMVEDKPLNAGMGQGDIFKYVIIAVAIVVLIQVVKK